MTPHPTQRSRPPQPHLHHRKVRVIETAIQSARPAQVADPSFDAIAEAQPCPKPRLLFPPFAARRFVAWLGQADTAHPQSPQLALVLGRVQPAVATDFAWGSAKFAAMGLHARRHQGRILWVPTPQPIFTDPHLRWGRCQPAFHFGTPNINAKLGLVRRCFTPPNDEGGVDCGLRVEGGPPCRSVMLN